MINPFEDEHGRFHVLINGEGQHSIWPTLITVPKGWTILYWTGSRRDCLDYVNENWTDMRPNGLIEKMR
jgi:uncharacterized protein YbdZ (MbtH family)